MNVGTFAGTTSKHWDKQSMQPDSPLRPRSARKLAYAERFRRKK